MRVLLAGGSGLIGSALIRSLTADGIDHRMLVRRAPRSPDEVRWHPETRQLDPSALEGIDAVVCLSGVGVGDHRWTESFRRSILQSRVDAVGTLARAVAEATDPPTTFISASAVGYYGSTGSLPADETAASGTGFFPSVCRAWEAAANPARTADVRVVNLRTGIVLAAHGPVLGRMVPLFRLGIGGRLGNGRQYWPWITLTDEVAAIRFALANDQVSGPINLTAPTPVTNAEFTRTLAKVLHRPAVLPVPAFALHAVLGGLAGDVLASLRVLPTKLLEAGYEFHHPDLAQGLRAELAT